MATTARLVYASRNTRDDKKHWVEGTLIVPSRKERSLTSFRRIVEPAIEF